MKTEIPSSPPTRPRTWRQGLFLALKWAVGGLALYLSWQLLRDLPWHQLSDYAGTASPLILGLAALLLVGRFAIWDLRFRIASTRATTRATGASFGFFVILASAALHLLNPTARVLSGVLRARYCARESERPFGQLYGVVLYDQLVHQVVMGLCALLACAAAALARHNLAIGLPALALFAAGTIAWALWRRRRPAASGDHPLARFLARRARASAEAGKRSQHLYAHGEQAANTFVELLGDRSLQQATLFLGVAWFLMNALAQWLIFASLGEPVDLTTVFLVLALGNLVGVIAATPGGLGTTEAAMISGFVSLGVDRFAAGASTLMFRGIHYLVILALGVPALIFLEWRTRASVPVAAPALPEVP
jgi:uncharacterized protein (TIRG00374 family)